MFNAVAKSRKPQLDSNSVGALWWRYWLAGVVVVVVGWLCGIDWVGVVMVGWMWWWLCRRGGGSGVG